MLLFLAIGNTAAARSVWDDAPGCYSHDDTGYLVNGCVKFILYQYMESNNMYRWAQNNGISLNLLISNELAPSTVVRSIGTIVDGLDAYQNEQQKLILMVSKACDTAHDYVSCAYLKSRGESIDMNAVAKRENQRAKDASQQEAKTDADYAQQRADSDAHFNSVMGALQSMPGGNNPNAVLDAGNRQAAQMRSIGDSNTGTQQQAQQQAAQAQQQATQARVAAQQQAQLAAQQAQTGYGAATTNTYTAANTSASAPEVCPNMQPYPDFGSHCNPVQSEASCVKVVTSSWHPPTATGDGSLAVTFENICGNTVRITVWGPAGGSNAGETLNVGSGQQYTFANDRQQYSYQVDDGIDCPGNNLRPSCRTGH